MYNTVWAKYLPIIRIVMKRSIHAEQILTLNAPDFERVGLKRKAGYKFNFGMKEGKLKNVIIDFPIASSLATVLLEDKVVQDLIRENEYQFSLSAKYELTIRHIPQPELAITTEE